MRDKLGNVLHKDDGVVMLQLIHGQSTLVTGNVVDTFNKRVTMKRRDNGAIARVGNTEHVAIYFDSSKHLDVTSADGRTIVYMSLLYMLDNDIELDDYRVYADVMRQLTPDMLNNIVQKMTEKQLLPYSVDNKTKYDELIKSVLKETQRRKYHG